MNNFSILSYYNYLIYKEIYCYNVDCKIVQNIKDNY